MASEILKNHQKIKLSISSMSAATLLGPNLVCTLLQGCAKLFTLFPTFTGSPKTFLPFNHFYNTREIHLVAETGSKTKQPQASVVPKESPKSRFFTNFRQFLGPRLGRTLTNLAKTFPRHSPIIPHQPLKTSAR